MCSPIQIVLCKMLASISIKKNSGKRVSPESELLNSQSNRKNVQSPDPEKKVPNNLAMKKTVSLKYVLK